MLRRAVGKPVKRPQRAGLLSAPAADPCSAQVRL